MVHVVPLYHCFIGCFKFAQGLVGATAVPVGVMNISAQLDSKILDNTDFCVPSPSMTVGGLGTGNATGGISGRTLSPTAPSNRQQQNCYGRYVQFGAQV